MKNPTDIEANVTYSDLREWMVEAETLDELQVAEGYNRQKEIGMAAALLQHNGHAPVALFDKIPGFPDGHRVLTNFFGGRRKNRTLGFPPGLSIVELSEALLKTFRKRARIPLPCEVVTDGPGGVDAGRVHPIGSGHFH